MGLIQVGRWGSSKKKRLCQSAQRAGRAQPTPMGLHFVHKYRNVTHLCFDLRLPYSRLAESHQFCHASVGYRSIFPCYTRISQFLSFLSPKFESVQFPAVYFHFLLIPRVVMALKRYASLRLWLATEESVMVICFWSQQIRHAKVD